MTLMADETREAPEAVERFLNRNHQSLQALGRRLRDHPPPAVLTSARGSSDNAAAYFKYLCEITTGVPVASVGASVVSIYGATLRAHQCLAITISQSGMSPDIVALQDAARKAGALTVAIVNAEDAPVARSAELCLPLHAGSERSVAATKTFITSLVAGAAVVAHWSADRLLLSALQELPDQLMAATQLPWGDFVTQAAMAQSLYVLGRGPSLPIAAESALKLKETCAIHAEAYSIAEVMHGPLELLGDGFPVLAYAQNDAALAGTMAAIARMRKSGAEVVFVGDGGLPHVRSSHTLLDPILMIQSAYLAIEEIARLRGRDPDRPRLLKKVTETL